MIEFEMALADFLLSQPTVTNLIGHHVYSGRIPTNVKASVAVRMITLDGSHYADIPGEPACMQTTMQIDVFGRGHPISSGAASASAEIWRQTAKIAFRGYMGTGPRQLFVHGATVVRDRSNLPIAPLDASDHWTHTYSQDILFTHEIN